jgi:autotransporter-associated beta strand protein
LESDAIVTDSFSNNGTDTLPGISLNGPLTFDVPAAGETLQISGAITGDFPVTKTGGGVLLLSGNSTYSGGTTLNAGALLVNGSLAASAVTVGPGGLLAGTGSVPSIVVQSGGTLSGNLTATAGTTFNAGSTFRVTVLSASSFSQLSGGVANLSAGPTLAVTVAGAYVPNPGTTFGIIPGAVTGTFNLLPNGATFGAGGVTFRINYASATLTAIANPASIPTLSWPGAALLTILLLGLGMRMLSHERRAS